MGTTKKPRGKAVSLYANLVNQRKANKDYKSRKKAEYLATLPKHPVERFFYRLHPKRFFAFWFSRDGAKMALKVVGVGLLAIALLFGILFTYYRQELNAIRPSELEKRVQTTVTRYYDRNGVLLWEDKGDGDYKLVVNSDQISQYMKDATVAIEDKDFYKHGGFSMSGILRALVSNSKGGSTQGGSTLTQQLVKQVFFADEAGNRGLSGIPRKIKEVILSVEVERTYKKDQILTMYLNESPYGGRRNGVESAAQTYFGKSAKDLSLAESALLAAIPQNPTMFNPYNGDADTTKALLTRQHTVLDYMAEQGKITKQQADEAKKVAIIDTITPESKQYTDIKAPHFVQLVKGELEQELGKKTVGDGGLTVKTTLDWRVQQIVDKSIDDLFASSWPARANFDNGAATMVDSQTGQILALRGSRDYNYPDYGAVNSSVAFIQPGSSIKPFVYSSLFKQRSGTNWGAGSILADDPIPQSIYKTDDGQSVANFDNKFRGAIPIRSGLAESRNVPAIKAMYINDKDNGSGDTIKTIRSMGDLSYCTNGVDAQAGLSSAIGGCGVKQIEHVNTFATLARLGVYKPVASILEVKNSQGQIVKQWKDTSTRAVDPQVAYMVADILSDPNARAPSFGSPSVQTGLNIPEVKTLTKTGTSNAGTKSKDLWINSASPKATLSVWVGNHDTRAMSQALSSTIGWVVRDIQVKAHQQVFQKDGTWKPGDWLQKPAGIQSLSVSGRTDIFPSWYTKSSAGSSTGTPIVFDKVSRKKATDCTPDAAKITINVSASTDPLTKRTTYSTTSDGYDPNSDDDTHKCDDTKPFVGAITYNSQDNQLVAEVTIGMASHPLQSVEFKVDDQVVGSVPVTDSSTVKFDYSGSGKHTVTVTVTDVALYSSSNSTSVNFH